VPLGFVIALAADATVTSAPMRIVVASASDAISSPFFLLPIQPSLLMMKTKIMQENTTRKNFLVV
jgi:hypothetical protein